MSSKELSAKNPQASISYFWTYDGGKAWKRAIIASVATTIILTPISAWHYISWYYSNRRVWLLSGPPRVRIPGLPYYWIDTAICGILVASLANALTAFFATATVRKDLWNQLRLGALYALTFPGLAAVRVVRMGEDYGNSPSLIALFLWLPLVLGSFLGVRLARDEASSSTTQIDEQSHPNLSRSFYVSHFLQKSWNAALFSSVRRFLKVAVVSVAIFRLITFIRGF